MSQLPLRSIVLGVVAVLISVLIVACGTSPGSPKPSQPAAAAVLPVPVTTEFRVGDNRTVFSLLDPAGQKPVASPDRSLSISYRGPGGESIAASPQTFVW